MCTNPLTLFSISIFYLFSVCSPLFLLMTLMTLTTKTRLTSMTMTTRMARNQMLSPVSIQQLENWLQFVNVRMIWCFFRGSYEFRLCNFVDISKVECVEFILTLNQNRYDTDRREAQKANEKFHCKLASARLQRNYQLVHSGWICLCSMT